MEVPTQLSVFGISLHLYGLIIGLAVVVGWQLVERVIKQEQFPEPVATRAFVWMLGGVVLGARAWHVATDWRLYQDNFAAVFYIWNGGMSILGAILGGFLALLLVKRMHNLSRKRFLQLTDTLVLALPVAQAVGRLANWVNQELYGLPTDLPWKLFIAPEHRLPGYEQYAFYHPLFAYEALGSLALAGYLWFLYRRQGAVVGRGTLTLLYVIGYGSLRFLLDFLRVDKSMYGNTGLGVNQTVLLVVLVLLLVSTWKQWSGAAKQWLLVLVLGLVGTAGVVWFLVMQRAKFVTTAPAISQFPQRQLSQMKVGEQVLTVEIVDTPEKITLGLSGRSEIGADGMLFIFEQPRTPGFWMKDMQFDLDLVWIVDNTILALSEQVPAPSPGTTVDELPVFYPPGPVAMVLEVPAGFAAAHNWQVGESVSLDKVGISTQ